MHCEVSMLLLAHVDGVTFTITKGKAPPQTTTIYVQYQLLRDEFNINSFIMVQMLDPAVLIAALNSCARGQRVEKILSMDDVPAVAKGQNYLSTVKRLKMRVLLGNGRIVTRSAILKRSDVESEAHKSFLKDMAIFKTEITMYSVVLKEMEYLMAEFESTVDVLWCRLLHHEPYSTILLEDLRVSGFKSLLIPSYLDMDHTLLVLRNLGMFHGMGKVLEERGIISESDFPPWYAFNKPAYRVWHSYIQELANVMNKKWDPSWEPVIRKLQALSVKDIEERMEQMKSLCQCSPFKVVNHGDLILPNIMFKYNWRNHPISVRFIDFQFPTYGSPCIDLIYFLNRSLKPSVKKENLKVFVEFYLNSLLAILDKFGFKGRRPTCDDLMAEMEMLSFLGSVLFAVNYAPMQNTEGLFGSEVHKDIIFSVYNKQDSEENMGPGIRDFIDNHLS